MNEQDEYVTVHASAPVAPEPLCPKCGRWARVWPSEVIGPEGPYENWCTEFGFHGFTYGDDGTIAKLYDAVAHLADQLRGWPSDWRRR